MQRICSVALYQQMLKQRVSDDDGDDEDQWGFVREQTSMYESQIQWKKAVTAYNSLIMDTAGGTVLKRCSKYFAESVDVLQLQAQEKSGKHVIKYMADLAAKFMPVRFTPGKGLCKKYVELFMAAFKLSLPTTDSVPQIALSETQLNNLSITS